MTGRDFDRNADAVAALAALSGAELTSALLGLARERSARRTPEHVLDQYQRDRFVGATPVDWTQQLLHSRKERCMTSGISLERLAMLEP